MARVLVDTSVLVDYLRGRAETVERLDRLLASGDTPHTCAIVVDEVVRGLRAGEEPQARALFAGLREVPLGTQEGWRAGVWRREFASHGRALSQSDCLIAAAAVSVGARLATANLKDFPIEDLTVEDWGRPARR